MARSRRAVVSPPAKPRSDSHRLPLWSTIDRDAPALMRMGGNPDAVVALAAISAAGGDAGASGSEGPQVLSARSIRAGISTIAGLFSTTSRTSETTATTQVVMRARPTTAAAIHGHRAPEDEEEAPARANSSRTSWRARTISAQTPTGTPRRYQGGKTITRMAPAMAQP